VEEDAYFLNLLRYVEANPVRAKLAARAEQSRWSSLGCGARTSAKLLSAWPLERPRNWRSLVNEALAKGERQRIKTSLKRGRPLGRDSWVLETAERLDLEYTLNPRGRLAKSATIV
jgi:putative transposase